MCSVLNVDRIQDVQHVSCIGSVTFRYSCELGLLLVVLPLGTAVSLLLVVLPLGTAVSLACYW
jgi:hypothetical protein